MPGYRGYVGGKEGDCSADILQMAGTKLLGGLSDPLRHLFARDFRDGSF